MTQNQKKQTSRRTEEVIKDRHNDLDSLQLEQEVTERKRCSQNDS
jgi:hypothetical protein